MAGINPMAFVTPYTAVGTTGIGAGARFADIMQNARNAETQKGWLKNAERQQSFNEEKYGQKEVDTARQQLDAAMMLGNPDAVEAAANNLRAVGSRYGVTIAETRSDSQLKGGVATAQGEQQAEVGSEANPLNVDAYDAQGKGPKASPFDADSPEFQAEAQAETSGVRPPGGSLPTSSGTAPGIRTPGGSLPVAAPAPETTKQPPLQGYSLIDRDGKPLYTVAPKDVEMRQRQRVSDVFAGLMEQTQDQDEHTWLKQGQAEASKLVGVMPIDDAVKMGLQQYMNQMNNRNKLSVVEANRKPRYGGPGTPTGLMGKNDDKAESTDKYGDNIEMALQHRGIPAAEESLAQAEGALTSGDPALQKDALKIILKARSGLTVSEGERRSYSMVDGALPAIGNAIAQWTGQPLDPQTIQSYLNIVRNMRRANTEVTAGIIMYERNKYEAQNRDKVSPERLKERSESLDPKAVKPTDSRAKALLEK